MTELAKADSVRTLKDAPVPRSATANAVAETIEKLQTMMGNVLWEKYNNESISNYNTVYGATTDDSSIKTKNCKSCCTHKKSKKTDDDDFTDTKERKKSKKKKKEKEKKRNDCPHCKKYHRCHPHPYVPKERSFWNKKYNDIAPGTSALNWRSNSNPPGNSQPS